jgi:vesicle-associated membrane protein 7
MSFIYSLIARESNIVLADYTEYSGNFEQVARIVLQKGIKHNCKYIINYDKYKMHYINENNLTFLCITDQVSDDTAFAFLSEIKLELLKMYSFEQLQEFYAYQLKKGIDLLNKYMIYYNTNPLVTKGGEVINELKLAKDAAIDNVEKLLERNEKMDLIISKSEGLKDVSTNVGTVADFIRRNETQRKNKYIVFAVILVGILVILFIFLK